MTTNNSNAISMLCGDEIFAGIVDLGTALCKFGTAGQETPRHIFKSVSELFFSFFFIFTFIYYIYVEYWS